jgi:N-dimethylarginine dimethylaminohydrolase
MIDPQPRGDPAARGCEAEQAAAVAWGVDSEHGRLLDILLCPPDHFRWLPTSAISRATLASGRVFDSETARRQHAELVSAYRDAGATPHFLEPEPALPYQVFTRDSSVMTPWGAVVTQLKQSWRRGEYAPVIRFYRNAGIPVWRMITAGALEGGDVMIVEPGVVLIGAGEERTEHGAASQLAAWFEAEGWEARVEPIPSRFVHIDVLVAVLAAKLAAVCVEVCSTGLVRWLRGRGFEIVEVPAGDAFRLGVNAISLGADRVLSGAGAETLNDDLRARGIEVLAPEVDAFTLGGGGAHCLGQALRRERVAGTN